MKRFRNQEAFDIQKQEIGSMIELHKQAYIDVYFGDESHFGLVPNIPYAWQTKDNPILQPSLKSKRLTVFGLMTTDCKLFSKIIQGSMNSEKIIQYIDEFARTILKRTVIILDNASIHKSKAFKAKIQDWRELDLYSYFLPPYSPELNKIEILWRFIKYHWLPFEAFCSFEKLNEHLNIVIEEGGRKYIINYL